MPAHVITVGDTPIGAAVAPWTAEAQAFAIATRHIRPADRPEYEWRTHTPTTRRLMYRSAGRTRWQWSNYAVHEVPLVEEQETTPEAAR